MMLDWIRDFILVLNCSNLNSEKINLYALENGVVDNFRMLVTFWEPSAYMKYCIGYYVTFFSLQHPSPTSKHHFMLKALGWNTICYLEIIFWSLYGFPRNQYRLTMMISLELQWQNLLLSDGSENSV